jgi:hypothetical protein
MLEQTVGSTGPQFKNVLSILNLHFLILKYNIFKIQILPEINGISTLLTESHLTGIQKKLIYFRFSVKHIFTYILSEFSVQE